MKSDDIFLTRQLKMEKREVTKVTPFLLPQWAKLINCRTAAICITLFIALESGGCVLPRDVTHDPSFGFAPLAARCFVIQQDVSIDGYSDNTDLDIQPMPSPYMPYSPMSSADYYANQAKYDEWGVLGIIPAGTRIRLERLTYDGFNTRYNAKGRFLGGKYKGKTAEIVDILTYSTMNEPKFGGIDTRYLQSCEESQEFSTQPDHYHNPGTLEHPDGAAMGGPDGR